LTILLPKLRHFGIAVTLQQASAPAVNTAETTAAARRFSGQTYVGQAGLVATKVCER